ncbi:MAG: sugar phosphate nucleotidyltransferase [candidate division Zixibacteria bacterium]|nr:sugar phosphate nucleotidyltransferase [candidate division Zixibacteria bacterium]
MNNSQQIIAVVLAAGKGKRMKSELPKVLLPIAGRPLITYLTDTLKSLGLQQIVLVVGYGRELVQKVYEGTEIAFAVQHELKGTADAVKSAREYFRKLDGGVLVITGDVPLLRRESLAQLIDEHFRRGNAATVLTSIPPDATGYGRIVRDSNGRVKKIVEQADCTNEEQQIREINTGILLFNAPSLDAALDKVNRNNAQGEYYLTDVLQILLREGKATGAVVLDDYREALGVNSVEQLQELEAIFVELKR